MSVSISKKQFSVLLWLDNYSFLEEEAINNNITKWHALNNIIKSYKKYKLKKQMEKWLEKQDKKDIEMAEEWMEDYFNIINKS